jgi:hypothetical protein
VFKNIHGAVNITRRMPRCDDKTDARAFAVSAPVQNGLNPKLKKATVEHG